MTQLQVFVRAIPVAGDRCWGGDEQQRSNTLYLNAVGESFSASLIALSPHA